MMSPISPKQQATNLEKFFRSFVNMTTRERIFFNRLAFDLKIAAARADYHLHLNEPDVDRDGFDIFMEDQNDGRAWIQTKAVISSARTNKWDSFAGFIRPRVDFMDKYGLDAMQCGRGGGVILIEINSSSAQGNVTYSYTDYRVLTALANRYIVKRALLKNGTQGAPKKFVQTAAQKLLGVINAGRADTPIEIPRSVFVKATEPDSLLALMALQNSSDFGAFSIQDATESNVEIDLTGNWHSKIAGDHEQAAKLAWHMQAMCKLLDKTEGFLPFVYNKPKV